MKHSFVPILLLIVFALTACSGRKRQNNSVTIGYINWRSAVIDSAATDSATALANDTTTHFVYRKPDVKILKVNPFATVSRYLKYYFEAPDSLIVTDSLALARPELADSIRDAYDSDAKVKYANSKMGGESANSLFGSSLIIVISALVLLIFLILKIYKVFIRSPFEDDEED